MLAVRTTQACTPTNVNTDVHRLATPQRITAAEAATVEWTPECVQSQEWIPTTEDGEWTPRGQAKQKAMPSCRQEEGGAQMFRATGTPATVAETPGVQAKCRRDEGLTPAAAVRKGRLEFVQLPFRAAGTAAAAATVAWKGRLEFVQLPFRAAGTAGGVACRVQQTSGMCRLG